MEDSKKVTRINNQGLSMVELIVVVGIMAVLIGAISLGFAVITNSYAREAAGYVTDALGTARTKATSITAEEWNVTFTFEGEGNGYTIAVNKLTLNEDGSAKVSEVIEEYKIDSDIVISYRNASAKSGAVAKIPIDSSNNSLTIAYKLGQGSVSRVSLAGANLTLTGISSIIIESGNFSRTIELYHTTGRYDIIDD